MTELLISPAERPLVIKHLGVSSPLPERAGADVLWHSDTGLWCGVQRKELMDLIASVHDDRLMRELIQMQELHVRVLIIEGRPDWGPNGQLINRRGHWSRKGHHNLIQSLSASGITVHTSNDVFDTAEIIRGLVEWTNKTEHRSLLVRPKNVGKVWGTATSEDWGIYLLQSFPGISYIKAKRIFEKFGIPFIWTVTAQELQSVHGIGKETAQRLISALACAAGSGQSPDLPTPLAE